MNKRKDKLKFNCNLDYLQKPWWHMNSKLQNPLQKKLNDREWILADGATGTNLFNMGLSSGNAPEIWNRTNDSTQCFKTLLIRFGMTQGNTQWKSGKSFLNRNSWAALNCRTEN